MRNLIVVILLCFLFGCAHNQTVYNYADYQSSLLSGTVFYSQYEISYFDQRSKRVIAMPFLANSNEYLPEKVIKLHFGLLIKNPSKVRLKIWSNSLIADIDNPEKTIKESRIVELPQSLPEGFVSIDMPFITNLHCKVQFNVTVISAESGMLLYKSPESEYRIKGENNKNNINLKKEKML